MGTVEEARQLGNTKCMITVRTPSGLVRVRGLDTRRERHPALPNCITIQPFRNGREGILGVTVHNDIQSRSRTVKL